MRCPAKHNELRRISHRQRAEHHGVNEAEDGGVRADAERERQHRHGRKSRTLCERPQPEAKILKESFHRFTPAENPSRSVARALTISNQFQSVCSFQLKTPLLFAMRSLRIVGYPRKPWEVGMKTKTKRAVKKSQHGKKGPTVGARIIEGLEQAIAWKKGKNERVRVTLVHEDADMLLLATPDRLPGCSKLPPPSLALTRSSAIRRCEL
jgi:hypothetical protein